MLVSKYLVLMNSKEYQIFTSYMKAYECREILERKFPNAIIEIEPYYN